MMINKQLNIVSAAIFFMAALICTMGPWQKPVWASSQILTTEVLEKVGKNFMLETLQWDKDRLRIKVLYEGKQLILPAGNVSYDCKLPGGKNRVGRVHFLCLIKMEGITKKRIRLYADVTVDYDVYRPVRSLKLGHIIQPGDVELVRVKSDQVLRNTVSEERDVLGHRLIRDLEEGEILSTHMIQKIPLVKNGDQIMIIVQKGSLRVTAPGVVLQNGFRNETVRVENLQSRKMLLGTVIDSKTVQINF